MKVTYSYWKMLKGIFSWKSEIEYLVIAAIFNTCLMLMTVDFSAPPLDDVLAIWLILTGAFTLFYFMLRTSLKLIYITLLWYILKSPECDDKMISYYKELTE